MMRALILVTGIGITLFCAGYAIVHASKPDPDAREVSTGCCVAIFGIVIIVAGALG